MMIPPIITIIMAEDISRISWDAIRIRIEIDGVGRIRTSGLQRPRLASYQPDNDPLHFHVTWYRQRT